MIPGPNTTLSVMESNESSSGEHSRRLVALVIGLRSALGIWFAFSGGNKLFVAGLDRFTRDIANYRMVEAPWDAVAAYTVPWLEMIVGVCLLLGLARKGALLTTAGLVAVFSLSIGWAWWHQLDIACGCHGGDGKIHYWWKSAELAGYFILLGWLWWADGRGYGTIRRDGRIKTGHEARSEG